MKILDCEKLSIGLMLRYPNGSKKIPERICAELETDKYDSLAHRRIYGAIKQLVIEGQIPTSANVALTLKEKLDDCGGFEYLESLVRFPELIGITEPEAIGPIVREIDKAGRLRLLGTVLNQYNQKFQEFEKLIEQTDDVDEFMTSFMDDIDKSHLGGNSSYKHISEAADKELRRLDMESDGMIVNIIPCRIPSLYSYFIPRQDSLGCILGPSSMGKTSLALQIAMGVAIDLYENKQKGVVSMNSLETPDVNLMRTMACIYAGIDSTILAKGEILKGSPQYKRYKKAIEYIVQLPFYYDDNPDMTSDQLTWEAMSLHLRYKRVLGISDYAELFTDKKRNEHEERRITNVVRNHKMITRRISSCEILLSQFSGRITSGSTKLGTLSDTRYTSGFENDLDWGLVIYNPPQMKNRGIEVIVPQGKREDVATIIVQKNRGYAPGEIHFNWQAEYSRFVDMSLPIGKIYSDNIQEKEVELF